MKRFLLLLFLSHICLLSLSQIAYVKMNATGNGSSWEQACGNLKTLLDTTSASEVWVAEGVYYADSVDVDSSFILSGDINLYGGFTGYETSIDQRVTADLDEDGTIDQWEFVNATVLDGNMMEDDNSLNNTRRILIIHSENSDCLIDGFTITNGRSLDTTASGIISYNGTIRNCRIINCNRIYQSGYEDEVDFIHGGGIAAYNTDMRNIQVKDCTLKFNNIISPHEGGYGGGMYLINCTLEHAEISGCLLIVESYMYGYGGGIYATSTDILDCDIRKCKITNPGPYTSYGGGAHITNSTLISSTVDSCYVTTDGGGIYARNCEIINCAITNNIAVSNGSSWGQPCGGGIVGINGNIVNCLVARNEIRMNDGWNTGGAGIYCNSNVINCTVVNNKGAHFSNGVSGGNLFNTIIWGPENNSWDFEAEGYNCAIQSAINTPHGSIRLEPVNTGNEAGKYYPYFIDPESDWDLQIKSSCINRGTSVLPASMPESDLAGRTRVFDGLIDIGAYESNSPLGYLHKEPAGINVFPNPASTSFRLEGLEVPGQISIYELSGKLIKTIDYNGHDLIDVSKFKSGQYLIYIHKLQQSLVVTKQ